MQLKANIHYTVYGNFRGEKRFREEFEFEFREASFDEAPLAYRDNWKQVRHFEGRHYALVAKPRDPGGADVAIGGWLPGLVQDHHCWTFRSFIDPYQLTSDRKYTHQRHPTVTDERARLKALEKAETMSRSCIVVGDDLWVRCGEPRLVVKPPAYYGHKGTVDVLVSAFGIQDMPVGPYANGAELDNALNHFRLDDPEGALAYARDIECEAEIPAFELYMPETLQTDPARDALTETAYAVADMYRENKLPTTTIASAGKELEALDKSLWMLAPWHSDPEELFEHVSAIKAKVPGRNKPLAHKLGLALSRWEERPVAVDRFAMPAMAAGR